MDLSILILTVPERKDNFLARLLNILTPQVENRPNVEVLVFEDDRKLNEGTKRNLAINSSKGKYFVFVDDDDRVAEDYVDSILAEIPKGPDTITFNAIMTIDGKDPKLVRFGMGFVDKYEDGVYYRVPNHIVVHRRDNVKELFPNAGHGCDFAWASTRKKEIKTQVYLNKTLYFYEYVSRKPAPPK